MVQQIASGKTESAASALPFTLSASALSVQTETRQSFNNELLRQSSNNDVIDYAPRSKQTEYAKQKNAQAEQYSRPDRHNNSDPRAERFDNETRNQKLAKERDRERADDQQLIRQKEIADTEYKKVNKTPAATSQSNNNTDSSNQKSISEGKVYKTITQENNAVDSASIAEKELVLPHASPAEKEVIAATATLPKADSIEEQFDYIDYVTQMAEFTGSELQQKNGQQQTLETVNIDPEMSTLQTDSAAIAELKLNLEDANGHYKIPNEFITAKLPNAELQTNLDTQPAQLTDDNDVSTQAHVNVSNIVDDLIEQFDLLPTDSSRISSEELSIADKALLSDILFSSSQSTKNLEGIELAQQTDINPESSIVNLTPSGVNEKINANTAAAVTPANIINSSSVEESLAKIDLKSDSQKSESSDANARLVNINQATIVENNDPKTATNDKKTDPNTTSLQNITQLNDEQTQVALESLTARVQKVASEINGEAKGNQFIAALQSGVKEFKQQLAQGLVPEHDLKTLVDDALAQISGESTSTQQPKVDATIKQFNAVLNLANSVNYAATQQQAQPVELTDNFLAKEFNLQHIEGTKLAKGIQSQLSAQTSIDKAINIFKQEGQQKLAEKVRWMVNSKNATAEIRLDPPDLGGINIKINLSGDTALVNFNVQSAAAKEALDQATPKLREMLQEQDIELGESVVQHDNRGDQREESSPSDQNLAKRNGGNLHETISDDELDGNHNMVEQRVSGSILGGVDYYA